MILSGDNLRKVTDHTTSFARAFKLQLVRNLVERCTLIKYFFFNNVNQLTGLVNNPANTIWKRSQKDSAFKKEAVSK